MQYKHLALAALAAGFKNVAAQDNNGTQSLNATLTSSPQLSNLTSFLAMQPQLLEQLSNAQNITILAPSDEAFAELISSDEGQALATDAGLVAALLQYHILNGTYMADAISNSSTFVPTLLMNETYSNVTGGQVVEAVMVGDEVVFYSGLLQNATVSQADVNFTGGVIHIVDSVLTLPMSVLETAAAANLTSLRGAVNYTNLIDTVNDTPDLTIFAPTNEAFQSIGSALENISESDLANILAYHVVNGTVGYSSDLMNGTSLQTANGANLTVTIDGNGTVFVNSARVIIPNVLVANGVVHVIDNVLNPENTEAPEPDATTGAPAFTASPGTDVPYTSGQPTPTTQLETPTERPAGGEQTQSSSTGAAMPMKTGAVGMGALLGAGAAVFFV